MGRHKRKSKKPAVQPEAPVEEQRPVDPLVCEPNGCPFFSLEPEILEDKIIDGVRQRKVRRLCLYDLTAINSWRKICPRKLTQRRIAEGKFDTTE